MEKTSKKHSLLSVIAIIFLSFSFLTACPSGSEDSSEAEAHSESIAKEESEKAASEEAESEREESESIAESESEEAESERIAQEEASRASESAAAQAQAEQAQANNNDNNSQAGNAPVNNGDMNTADANAQGTIVGNSRSMIYHVPGQRGYRMNSENAVYFNTEAEAQAAGYRRSLR